MFGDRQCSPAPSPVCWGRLGWGSPYHTGGYANVSLMETIARPRDCTMKSPLLRWTPLHNCLFRDGRSSPVPSPVCWGRLGWGSPYHTGGYANVSLMETIARPRDCTKKSPLIRWTPLHNCLFRDGRSSPAPSPVCWGRLGWGSPYHTGGYANVSSMETSAQPRECTKKSPSPQRGRGLG